LERPQGERERRQIDEDDAPHPEAIDDRTMNRARWPQHDIKLVRLEEMTSPSATDVTMLTQRI
jgi:hypothetical protein